MAKGKRRGRGEGSVYQRQDGRWVAEIKLEDGKRKPLYGKTQAEAIEKRNQAQYELRQGIAIATGSKQKLKDYLEYWLEDVCRAKVRQGTYLGYRGALNKHLIPGLGHIQLQKLTTQHIQSFYAKKQREGCSPNRIQFLHAVLHGALRQAKRERLIASNVGDEIDLPTIGKHEVQPFTFDQSRLFLDKIHGHRMEALLTLALATGMREGELLGLRWQDVDLQKGTLQVCRTVGYASRKGFYVNEPKTVKGRRTLTLPQFAIEPLVRHRVAQKAARLQAGPQWVDNDLVFPNDEGGFIIAKTLRRRWYRLLQEIGLPRIHFHDLRHSAATILLSMGVPMKVVQQILGHSNYGITANIYGHVLPEMQEEAMNKMDAFFRQQP